MVVVGIEAEIEKLRTKREMLEVDSASYSSSTVAKWRERLSFVKIQCEEAKARNQRFLDETRDVSKEFCERARVVKLSEKAFGYDVAVKEYLKKVRKLLPQWIEGVQFEAGKDQRSELARTPRSTTAKVVLDSAESRSAKFVSPALGRSFEAGHDTASPSARSLGQERSRERFSASAAFLRDEEAEDGKEMDEDPPRSTASLSPAFVPVQTASFTSMTKSIESNKKKRTPVASSVALNSPAAQDPKAESPRARERETVTAGTPKYQTPGSAVQSTPTRVRFLSQEAELAEDSVDTFDSYAKTGENSPASIRQSKSETQAYYTESEKSSESFRQASFHGHARSAPGSAGEAETSHQSTPKAKAPDSNATSPLSVSQSQGHGPRQVAPPAAKVEESTSSDEESESEEPVVEPPVQERPRSPPKTSKREEDAEEKGDHGGKPDGNAPKVSTIANRTFDTDTEDSETFYQGSHLTRQLSKESSDEFDF